MNETEIQVSASVMIRSNNKNKIADRIIITTAIALGTTLILSESSQAASLKKTYNPLPVKVDLTLNAPANLRGYVGGISIAKYPVDGSSCDRNSRYDRVSPYNTSKVVLNNNQLPVVGTAQCTSPNGSVTGQANASVAASQVGSRVTGALSVNGFAETPVIGGGYASAKSLARLTVNQHVRNPNGTLTWVPYLQAYDPGQTFSTILAQARYIVREPATGNTLSRGDFAKIKGRYQGNINLDDDSIDFIGVNNGTFQIEFPGLYTKKQGNLFAKFEKGCLIAAETDGFFSGWLPSVGTCGDFSINSSTIPNFDNLNFDFNLSEFADPVNFTFEISSGVSVGVPEPTTIIGTLAMGLTILCKKRSRKSN